MTSAPSPPTRDSTARPPGDAPDEPQTRDWLPRLRRFGYTARPVDDVGLRLDPPYAEPNPRLWALLRVHPASRAARSVGWGGPLLVALFAGILRFWQLGKPNAVIFDETYYAKDAWALLKRGYEVRWPEKYNDTVIDLGSNVPVGHDPSYVVHPPMGKWVIAAGEWLFGLTPFGWRFMVALLGTLSVLMVCRVGRRMFRSTFLGCLAGLLLAVDGLHFVMSRTALLDLPLMFFVLAAFCALVIDRDKARARLAAALPMDDEGVVRPDASIAETLRLGRRPWRIVAGVALGLAFATKWNGGIFLAAFGLMTVLWDVGARRTAGARRPYLTVLKRDVLPAFVSTVPVAVVTYLATWTGWLLNTAPGDRGYLREWGADHPSSGVGGLLPDWWRSLWHYSHQVWEFHVGLTTPHDYESNPWSWLVLGRPVSYYYESPAPGAEGCPADAREKCASEVLALGTPLLWWAACFAILYVLWRWFFRRDWRAGAIAAAFAAGFVPWLNYQERTIFLFYAVVFIPYLCLGLAMMIGAMIGRAGSSERRRVVGVVGAGVLVLLIIWNFIYFWPLYTAHPIPVDSWRARMWFDTWV
ncbi:dolichyl-phosphate-mannose--protein mannosyltransferase [Streptomyces sp. NPDC050418]|uniref:dolichyl-phosphate-mannose--protein mannosyltransferase n=1 Tax=Streptomyces sp. NPDC050418 TaxID=3365612 RepID=UPI00378D581C